MQQWLVLGLGARNIVILVEHFFQEKKGKAERITTIVVGVAFGLLHALAEPSLVFACLFMGVVCLHVFFRYSCLYPLGVFHGVLFFSAASSRSNCFFSLFSFF